MTFFEPGPADDPVYERIRDDSDFSADHEWLEVLWAAYEPVNPDRNFRSAAKAQLTQSFWQMYVAYVLRENGMCLRRPKAGGPDVLIESDGGRTWVEAVCPKPGSGRDEVKRRPSGGGLYSLDRRAIRLRYTTALEAKARQHRAWLKAKVVADIDKYIVAIGGAELVDSDLEKGAPDVVRAVLGLGEFGWNVPVGEGWSAVELAVMEEREILNKNLAPVSTDGFLTGLWPNVSGVLFSPTRLCDHSASLGRDMVFVANHKANVPADDGYFGFGRAYRVCEGHLRCFDFRGGL